MSMSEAFMRAVEAEDAEIAERREKARSAARKAWEVRRGERAPAKPRPARNRVSVVDGPFAGRTLLLEREYVAGDEWAIPGAIYRFADVPDGRIAYTYVDDEFTPVIGWRAWHFARTDDQKVAPVLSSGHQTEWPGGAPVAAACDALVYLTAPVDPAKAWEEPIPGGPAETKPAHEAPAPIRDCGCGIYATLTHHSLEDAGYGGADVVGLLAGWGKVIEHTAGFRFARAYPVVLIVNSRGWVGGYGIAQLRRVVRELRQTYRVPVAAAHPEHIHERIAEAASEGRLPEWAYRALPPDLRAAGALHTKRMKEKERAE